MCSAELEHVCRDAPKQLDNALPRGFVPVSEYPEYMINKNGEVKKISNGDRCPFFDLTKDGEARIRIRVNGKYVLRSVQKLRDSAFPM